MLTDTIVRPKQIDDSTTNRKIVRVMSEVDAVNHL
eukprot:COSAG02_NODE_29470_length_568_cov_1.153518_1_plen_34_part_10